MSQNTPPKDGDADDFTQRLCARVKDERKERSWSLEELATASGVSRSMLSQIERGEANPTVAVIRRIAQAFAISVADLIDEPAAATRIEVIPPDDPTYVFRADGDCHIRTLSPLHMEKDIEIYELRLKPGAALISTPHFKGTREFLTIQQGTVEVQSADQTSILRKGYSAHYQADVNHTIANNGRGECVAILVVTYKS